MEPVRATNDLVARIIGFALNKSICCLQGLLVAMSMVSDIVYSMQERRLKYEELMG